MVRGEVAAFCRISERDLKLFSSLLETLPFHPQVFVYHHHDIAASQSAGNSTANANAKSKAKFHLAAPPRWLWRDRKCL